MKKYSFNSISMVALALLLTGCGSSSNTIPKTTTACPTDVKCVDASSYSKYTYYQLSELVKSADNTAQVTNAKMSIDWDIGFSRTSVIINDGTNGPGAVKAALAFSQTDFYDSSGKPIVSKFKSATKDNQVSHYSKASTKGITFKPSVKGTAIPHNGKDSWYSYDKVTHQITVHSNNYFLIRGSTSVSSREALTTNEYGRLRAVRYSNKVYTFGFSKYNNNGKVWATESTIAVTFATTRTCYDFSHSTPKTMVNCSGSNWDLTFVKEGYSSKIYLNSQIYGKGKARVYPSTVSRTVNPTDFNQAPFRAYAVDAPINALLNNKWYAYSLQGKHKIWPNFRVYLLRKGNNIYKMQIVSYYHYSSSKSGHYQVRIEAIK